MKERKRINTLNERINKRLASCCQIEIEHKKERRETERENTIKEL